MNRKALVLDQSTRITGYAVVQEDPDFPVTHGVTGRLLSHGIIEIPNLSSTLDRISIILADIKLLIGCHKPDEIVLENTNCIGRNNKTQNALGAMVLAIRELAAEKGLPVYMQNPKTIKKVFTGNGDATKQDIKDTIPTMWGPVKIYDDNHADALAAAFTWLYRGDEVRQIAAMKTTRKNRKAKSANPA